MKKLKRVISLALIAVLVTASVGCAGKGNSGGEKPTVETSINKDGEFELSDPGQFPIVKGDKKAELSIFASPQFANVDKLDSSVNEFTKWLEDKLNVHINWNLVPGADKASKLNIMFNGDDYDEVIMNSNWDGATQYLYGSEGCIIPLNDYLETDGYFYNKFMEAGEKTGDMTENIKNAMIMPDGKIYSLGQYSFAYHMNYSSRMWIYQPWLDKLGLKMPTTTDEFYNVLKAFKEKDPNGNGKADEVPLSGMIKTMGDNDTWNPLKFIMNSFMYYGTYAQQYGCYIDNDKVEISYDKDAFKEGLKYVNKLYAEGLLSKDIFTQTGNDVKALTGQEKQMVGCVPALSVGFFISTADDKNGDWLNYKVVPPLKGPNGVQYAEKRVPYPIAKFQITDKCKHPRIAFRLGDALYDEEIGLSAKIGLKGKYWDEAAEGELGLDGKQGKYKVIRDSSKDKYYAWGQLANNIELPGWHTGMVVDKKPEHVLFDAAKEYAPYAPDDKIVMPQLVFEDDDARRLIDIRTSLNDYINQSIVDFITTGNIDSKWDAYKKELKARNIDELQGIYQKAYDKYVDMMKKNK